MIFKKPLIKALLSIAILLITVTYSYCTTIIAPSHLGEMALNSDGVVLARCTKSSAISIGMRLYTKFEFSSIDLIKGSTQDFHNFSLLNLSFMSPTEAFKILGDIEFEEGKSYLLFLNKSNNRIKPLMLSYGIFENVHYKESAYLIPILESEELIIESKSNIDLLVAYDQSKLLNELKNYTTHSSLWKQNIIQAKFSAQEIRGLAYAKPSHCNYFTAGSKAGFRWINFETATMNMRFSSSLDAYFSGCNTQAANAISDLKLNYAGTNLTNGGTHSYSPNCSGGSAAGGNFINYINSTYGSSRNTLIIYNDPCDEIPDLKNCSGILAIGGLYGSGCTTYDGLTWYNGAYGYVIVNDSAGACLSSSSYKLMLTHELTHSLGLDHIASSSGNANMNPSCCKVISSLDIQCVDYLYPVSPTPVRLEYFKGSYTNKSIHLDWATATESMNEGFDIEKSDDGRNFLSIHSILGHGNSVSRKLYEYTDDKLTAPVLYYRLKQKDQNASFNYSYIITVKIPHWTSNSFSFKVDPTTGEYNISDISESNTYNMLRIHTLDGSLIESNSLENHNNSKNMSGFLTKQLHSGIYIAQLTSSSSSIYSRFIITN